MTKRRAKTCTACGKPLGEARLVVHTADGQLDGQFHASCFGPEYKPESESVP